MFIKQISVFMENRPGCLAEISKILSEHGIDMRAISISDTTEFGILRMIVSAPQKAEKVLRSNGMTVNITEVLAISIEDTMGAFYQAIEPLKGENINIEYLYSFIGEKSSRAVIVLKTSDSEGTVSLFQKRGIRILSLEDFNDWNYGK